MSGGIADTLAAHRDRHLGPAWNCWNYRCHLNDWLAVCAASLARYAPSDPTPKEQP